MGKDGSQARRVTTTLSIERKTELERLAERERVAEAWIVRRAVEQFLDDFKGKPVISGKGEADVGR
jgi:predicted transcriptional regulator